MTAEQVEMIMKSIDADIDSIETEVPDNGRLRMILLNMAAIGLAGNFFQSIRGAFMLGVEFGRRSVESQHLGQSVEKERVN